MPSIEVSEAAWRWLVAQAAEHHGGDVREAADAILGVLELAETPPDDDPWAYLERRVAARRWPPYRVPVAALLEFADYWEQRGGTAAEMAASMREAMTRRPGDER